MLRQGLRELSCATRPCINIKNRRSPHVLPLKYLTWRSVGSYHKDIMEETYGMDELDALLFKESKVPVIEDFIPYWSVSRAYNGYQRDRVLKKWNALGPPPLSEYRLSFGKHRGKRIDEVPELYLVKYLIPQRKETGYLRVLCPIVVDAVEDFMKRNPDAKSQAGRKKMRSLRGEAEETPVAKRKPGRPRKEPMVKRKRGRPWKRLVEEDCTS